jgi:AcrR family transcriptional regulator
LEQAAMALYAERGFEQTTVAEIASRAGLTERTFFRHFSDKREVLFGGSSMLTERLVSSIVAAPAHATPMDAVTAALETAGALFAGRGEHAAARQAIIDANPNLQERELIKLASLAASLTAALHQRGAADPAARLAAEVGIAVFKIAFDRWIAAPDGPTFLDVIHELLAELRTVTAGGAPA